MPSLEKRLIGAAVACVSLAGLALLLPAQGRSATPIESSAASASSAAAPAYRAVVRRNRPWVCRRHVNIGLVKVVMRTRRAHGIYLRPGCSGRIGRIEIDTWTQDGITINRGNGRMPAHDLVIADGYIRCHDNVGGHQDGVQVMDGRRITFRSVRIKCGRPNERGTNSQFYVSGNGHWIPRNVVCVRCVLGTGAGSPLFIDLSVDSGARNTTVCRGDFGYAVRIEHSVATRPIHRNLRILRRSHRLC
jgi:hypothetical protein